MKKTKPISLRVLRPDAARRRVPWWAVTIGLIVLVAIVAQFAR